MRRTAARGGDRACKCALDSASPHARRPSRTSCARSPCSRRTSRPPPTSSARFVAGPRPRPPSPVAGPLRLRPLHQRPSTSGGLSVALPATAHASDLPRRRHAPHPPRRRRLSVQCISRLSQVHARVHSLHAVPSSYVRSLARHRASPLPTSSLPCASSTLSSWSSMLRSSRRSPPWSAATLTSLIHTLVFTFITSRQKHSW